MSSLGRSCAGQTVSGVGRPPAGAHEDRDAHVTADELDAARAVLLESDEHSHAHVYLAEWAERYEL